MIASPPNGAEHRADIDGLRAVAVIPVILFHAHAPGFDGGYVGVDVFFVISGYLITQVLQRARRDPIPVALSRFYLRRARRILPALTVMLLLSAALAAFVLLPMDLERFGRFLTLSVLMLGNFAAWSSGGYFDSSSAALVHLWSIGIEEQFYLAYPLLFLCWQRSRPDRAPWLLTILALASFVSCMWLLRGHANLAFYAPVTRAWELLLGAIALRAAWWGPARDGLNEAIAWLALVALVACFFWFDPDTMHPGLPAAIPCLATLLLLITAARRRTAVARVLAWWPLAFTGLISYSLYLWHAPLLSLARYWAIGALAPLQLATLLVTIYLVAALSWRFVEVPVRACLWPASTRAFVVAATTASLAACICGLVFWRTQGLPARFDPQIRAVSAPPAPLPIDVVPCMTLDPARVAMGELCRFGPAEAPQRMVLWGDSHAEMLVPALRPRGKADATLFFAGRTSCRPLLQVSGERAWFSRLDVARAECARFNRAMIAGIARLHPDTVLLSGYWNMPEMLDARTRAQADIAREQLSRALQDTLAALPRSTRICLVLDVPTQRQVVPYALAMSWRRGLPDSGLRLTRAQALAQQADADDAIRAQQARWGFAIVDPKSVLCAAEDCALLSADRRPLYVDSNHLAPDGARLLRPMLLDCVRPADGER